MDVVYLEGTRVIESASNTAGAIQSETGRLDTRFVLLTVCRVSFIHITSLS